MEAFCHGDRPGSGLMFMNLRHQCRQRSGWQIQSVMNPFQIPSLQILISKVIITYTQDDLECLMLFKSKCANKEVTKQQKTKPHVLGYANGPKSLLEDFSNAKAGRTGGTKTSSTGLYNPNDKINALESTPI